MTAAEAAKALKSFMKEQSASSDGPGTAAGAAAVDKPVRKRRDFSVLAIDWLVDNSLRFPVVDAVAQVRDDVMFQIRQVYDALREES